MPIGHANAAHSLPFRETSFTEQIVPQELATARYSRPLIDAELIRPNRDVSYGGDVLGLSRSEERIRGSVQCFGRSRPLERI